MLLFVAEPTFIKLVKFIDCKLSRYLKTLLQSHNDIEKDAGNMNKKFFGTAFRVINIQKLFFHLAWIVANQRKYCDLIVIYRELN